MAVFSVFVLLTCQYVLRVIAHISSCVTYILSQKSMPLVTRLLLLAIFSYQFAIVPQCRILANFDLLYSIRYRSSGRLSVLFQVGCRLRNVYFVGVLHQPRDWLGRWSL